MSPPPLRVIKLGGSLLDWPQLPVAFHDWLAGQSPAANLLIAGGGKLVDPLRALDEVHLLPAEQMHWLAIRAMSVTARLAQALLPEAALISDTAALDRSTSGGLQILDVERFLREDQRSDDPLPADWSVTSDSIAARVAAACGAFELALLKSVSPAGPSTLALLAAGGHVDGAFPSVAASMNVRWVNLRARPASEIVVGSHVPSERSRPPGKAEG